VENPLAASVKLVTAYAQVSQYAINRCDIVQAEKPLQVTKVLLNKYYPFIIRQVFSCIVILVKGH
jgi:hypothetical protein